MTVPAPPDSRRRVSSDAVVIAVGYLTSFVYPLVSLPFLTRALGVATLGLMMLLLAVLQIVVHVTDFGFSISALRRASVARDLAERSRVVFESLWGKTLIWAGCVSVMIPVLVLVPTLREHAAALATGLALVLLGAWYPGWLLQARGQMTAFALTMALSRMAALAGLLATVRGPGDLVLAVGWQLAPQALAAIVVWALILRSGTAARPVPVTLAGVLAALRDSAPLFISNAAAVATGSANSVALGGFASTPQVAFFGAAERFGNAVRGVMRGVSDAMLPRLAAANEQGAPGLQRFITGGVLAAYGLSGLCLVLGAGWVIPWYLGADMTSAVTPTRLVGAAIAISGVTAALTLRANAAHRYGAVARITAIGAGIHLTLCIPGAIWGGATGVALALIGSELLLAALFFLDAAGRRPALRPREARP